MRTIIIFYKDNSKEIFRFQHSFGEQRPLKMRFENQFVIITKSDKSEVVILNSLIRRIECEAYS